MYQEYDCLIKKTDAKVIDTPLSYCHQLKIAGEYIDGKKIGIWIKTTRMHYGYYVERYDHTKEEKLEPYFEVNLRYPLYAAENEIEGTVILTFQEFIDCSISDIKITKSLWSGCDLECINKIKKLYELKRQHKCKCDDKMNSIKFEFRLGY